MKYFIYELIFSINNDKCFLSDIKINLLSYVTAFIYKLIALNYVKLCIFLLGVLNSFNCDTIFTVVLPYFGSVFYSVFVIFCIK